MNYTLRLPGFSGHTVVVQSPRVFSGYKLFIDGQPAPKGPRRGQMLMRRDDGVEVVAFWKPRVLGFDVPQLQVGDATIDLVPPLAWYAWLWGGLPILLVFVGGALGGLLGGLAFALNAKIFRTQLNLSLQFLVSGTISVFAVILYFVIAILLFTPTEPS